MGSLQLLSALQNVPKTPTKGLIFVDATINGKVTKALVDTGASHNFVSLEEAKILNLKVAKGGGFLKVSNSVAQPIKGVAHGVKVSLGAWTGQVNLTVALMDDYFLVLGLEFFDQVRDFIIPFLNSMYIMDGEKTCVVSTEKTTKLVIQVLSILQFKKGLKKEEESYLAINKECHEQAGNPKTLCGSSKIT